MEAGKLLAKNGMFQTAIHWKKTGVFRPLKDRLTGMDKEGIKSILYAIGAGGMPYIAGIEPSGTRV